MSIFSKIGGAIKNVATKAVSAVKKAASSITGKSQTANAFQAPVGTGLTKSQTATALSTIGKSSGLPSKTSQVIGKVVPGYKSATTKSYYSGGSGRDPQAYKPSTISASTQKLVSNNVPTSYSATDLGDGEEITPFETPSYISSNMESGNGLSGYLGASATMSGSNMGMSGSSVGTPTTTTPTTTMTPLEEEQKRREEEAQKNQQDLIDMMNELAGKPKEQAKLEKQTGLPQLNTELRDLQAKQTLQTAQYMQQQQDIQNKPIAMEFIAGQQGESARRAGIDAMITSALIQSKTGQIQTAQDTVDRALKLKYDPIVTRIDTQKAILEMNYDNLSRIDKKLADSRTALLDLQKTQTTYDRDIRKTLINDISKGISDGTIDSNTGYAQIQSIMDENTKLSDIYKQMGITDANNPGIVNGYDITSYATDPNHETKINAIVASNNITNSKDAQEAINKYTTKSPITGSMIISSANKYGVDPNIMFALMLNDSTLGTAGKAVRTLNPGNVGNTDTGAERKYSSWNAGVDGVAEWLSKHKAKALYNGEFADTINNIVTLEPQKSQGVIKKNLQGQIANGNYKAAYTQISNSVSKALTGENKTQYDAKRLAIPAIENLKIALQNYEDKGGKTGLLKGNFEKIYSKLGEVKDPNYKKLATDLRISLQNYRKEVSGAAFSDQESRDYESVNPAGTNTLALNSSIIDGMLSNFQRQVYSIQETIGGEGVKYIREYAMGIDPLLVKMNNNITGGGPTISNSDFYNNL